MNRSRGKDASKYINNLAETHKTWTRRKEKATADVGRLRKEGDEKIMRWRETLMDRVVWKERTDRANQL